MDESVRKKRDRQAKGTNEISYFEFMIVSEVQLKKAVPRLSIWSDNMKHPRSTPFAHISQKIKVSYDLPLDVVNFVGSSYNLDEQTNVKKKLRMISSNLHTTFLYNITRTISNCVDDVLRALCTNGAVDDVHNINPATMQSKDFSKEKNYSSAEVWDDCCNYERLNEVDKRSTI